MAREPNTEIIRFLHENYRPFDDLEVVDGESRACDSCREHGSRFITASSPKTEDRRQAVFLCIENGCAAALFGKSETSRLLFEMMEQEAGGRGIDKLATNVTKRDDMAAGGKVTGMVHEADAYWTNGFGHSWKIVPSLLEQWHRNHRLSPKQVSVLERYIRTCEGEVEHGVG